jgi:hypothetical protein
MLHKANSHFMQPILISPIRSKETSGYSGHGWQKSERYNTNTYRTSVNKNRGSGNSGVTKSDRGLLGLELERREQGTGKMGLWEGGNFRVVLFHYVLDTRVETHHLPR